MVGGRSQTTGIKKLFWEPSSISGTFFYFCNPDKFLYTFRLSFAEYCNLLSGLNKMGFLTSLFYELSSRVRETAETMRSNEITRISHTDKQHAAESFLYVTANNGIFF